MPDKPYTGVDNLEVMAGAKRYNSFLAKQVLSNSRGAKRILDFGAGVGVFSKALRKKGIDVICVETDAELLENLRDAGFEVYSALSQIESNSVDYIFSLNVLEHIQDDLNTLKELYRCLRPSGKVYLYVPAFDILYSSMDRKIGHHRRYRFASLVPLVKDAGFKVEKSYYVDSLGFVFSILFRIFGNKKGNLNPKIIKIYDTFFFPISRLIDFITGKILGKNLVIIATRVSTGNSAESPFL